jgi:hypothetical protein
MKKLRDAMEDITRRKTLSISFSMLNRTLQRSVNLCAFADIEQKRLHVFDQELLMFGIDRAQSIMIDELILRSQPGFPATGTNFSVNLFPQRAAERRLFQRWKLLPAPRTVDDLCHFT